MSYFYIEECYHLIQGAFVFQLLFFGIVYLFTRRKLILFYALFLLFTILYFFINAPMTFFLIKDELIFESYWYEDVNYFLLVGMNFFYIRFITENFNQISDRFITFYSRTSLGICISLWIMFFLFGQLHLSKSILFYATHFLTIPIGIYTLVYRKKVGINYSNFIKAGILFNIIGTVVTLFMILRYNQGKRVYYFDEYPLFSMRIGVLLEIFIFQFAILKNWYDQEVNLATKDLETKLKIEQLRNEISSDLHDDVGASLSKINMQSYLAIKSVNDEANLNKYLQGINKEVNDVIKNLTSIVASIKRNEIHDAIDDRIHTYLNLLKHDYPANISFENTMNVKNKDAEFLKNLYLIIKEAVNNALKYSNANMISIDLSNNELTISDNGNGFDFKAIKKGNGLDNMQLRADKINAKFHITSKQGIGTTIYLMFNQPQTGITM